MRQALNIVAVFAVVVAGIDLPDWQPYLATSFLVAGGLARVTALRFLMK
jgi:hypothetical protein